MPQVACSVARMSILLRKHLSDSSANFWGIPVVNRLVDCCKTATLEIALPGNTEDTEAKKMG